jgi:hypothetical protein
MMNDKYVLDLKDHIDKRETALVGREHGENLLKKLKDKGIIFKDIENKNAEIQIVVPKTIMSINKSFFLGFLETRIQELGTDGFRNKYSFAASDYILRKLDKNIDQAIFNDSQKSILGMGDSDE